MIMLRMIDSPALTVTISSTTVKRSVAHTGAIIKAKHIKALIKNWDTKEDAALAMASGSCGERRREGERPCCRPGAHHPLPLFPARLEVEPQHHSNEQRELTVGFHLGYHQVAIRHRENQRDRVLEVLCLQELVGKES